MQAIFLLFRKDLRRFWPEILAALLLPVAVVVTYPYTWLPHDETPFNLLGLPITHDVLGTLPGFLLALLPISWLVLIGRVIQDESLVGDRQYWVTRPISWRSLLAEKMLFLLLFAILPLGLSFVALLARAGLPVLANLPRAALLLLLDAASFVLPLVVLATLTRTFFRLFLTILGIFGVVLLAAFASGGLDAPSTFVPFTDPLSLPLFTVTCVLVILIQYSSRTIWMARTFLAICLALILIVLINPFEKRMLENLFYPAAQPHQLPLSLAIVNVDNPGDKDRPITLSAQGSHPSISIPLDVDQVPEGNRIVPENAQLTITSASGVSLSTGWQAIYNHAYLPQTRYGVTELRIDRSMLQLMRAGPVTLNLELAVAVYALGKPTRLTVPTSGALAVPTLGQCVLDPELSFHPGFTCRMPLRQPARFLLAAPWTTEPCDRPEAVADREAFLLAEPGTPNPTPVDVSLVSVLVSAESFSLPATADTNLTELPPVHLCPGSQVTMLPLELQRRARTQLTLPHYVLPQRYH